MALKRKLVDDAPSQPVSAKQMKLVPFPSSEQPFPDVDVDMDVDMSMDVDAHHFPLPYHTRLASSVSTASSDASSFDFGSDTSSPPDTDDSNTSSIHGRAYASTGFPHLKSGCKQIPRLRVACESGVSGRRSMWVLCEDCGAVQMLDS